MRNHKSKEKIHIEVVSISICKMMFAHVKIYINGFLNHLWIPKVQLNQRLAEIILHFILNKNERERDAINNKFKTI